MSRVQSTLDSIYNALMGKGTEEDILWDYGEDEDDEEVIILAKKLKRFKKIEKDKMIQENKIMCYIQFHIKK